MKFYGIFWKQSWLLFMFYEYVRTTEVTVSSHVLVTSLGMNIALPVFTCHAKHRNYSRVLWYKDFFLLRNGSASLSDHFLSLSSSLKDFSNPLTLQGYFWCETDVASAVHKYLFTIKKVNGTIGVNTYSGKLLSSDIFAGGESGKEKLKRDYELEMQTFLFSFLPTPNTHVTDIKIRPTGLEVSFFVYSRQQLDPRKPFDPELVQDEQELEHILEYINNETDIVDVHLYRDMMEWMEMRKINVKDIVLRSTLGCYSEEALVPVDPPKKISWPYAYMGDVVIPQESCSSKNGLAVTRMCVGTFYSGARWGSDSGKCDEEPGRLTSQLMHMRHSFGDTPTKEYIKTLDRTVEDEDLSITDLQILTDILTRLSNSDRLQSQTISGIFSIIDYMLTTNTTELASAKKTIQLTKRILKIIDGVMSAARSELTLIAKNNLLVYVKSTEKDHITGASVVSNGTMGDVEYSVNRTHKPNSGSSVFFMLPADLVSERELDLPFPCLLEMVFFKEWILFPNPKNVLLKRNYKVLPSPVILVSLSGGPAWNLSSPVELYFRNDLHDVEVEHPVCVYYDVENEEWSSEGCEYAGLKEGFYHCQCHHLSIFSVVLSVSPESEESPSYKLGTALYVGCSVSMIALAFSVVLYILSKNWRKTVDHSILFHLSLSFLGCLLLLILSEEKFQWKMSCFLISLMLHYFLIATFGWFLVHALVHKMRFGKKTDLEEVPYFHLKAAICTWGASGVITLVLWITRYHKHYNMNSCLMPLMEVSRAAVIPIVVLLLVTLCLNLCAVYAITCRYKKDYLLDNSSYHESVIKFRVAFTIFFLFVISWMFGLSALHQQYRELRILFSICITLTSYYMTLFFVFQETSFWEMCRQCKRNQRESHLNKEEVVTFASKTTE